MFWEFLKCTVKLTKWYSISYLKELVCCSFSLCSLWQHFTSSSWVLQRQLALQVSPSGSGRQALRTDEHAVPVVEVPQKAPKERRVRRSRASCGLGGLAEVWLDPGAQCLPVQSCWPGAVWAELESPARGAAGRGCRWWEQPTAGRSTAAPQCGDTAPAALSLQHCWGVGLCQSSAVTISHRAASPLPGSAACLGWTETPGLPSTKSRICLHAEGPPQAAALAKPWGIPVAIPTAGSPTVPADPSSPPGGHILHTEEVVVPCGFQGVCSEQSEPSSACGIS